MSILITLPKNVHNAVHADIYEYCFHCVLYFQCSSQCLGQKMGLVSRDCSGKLLSCLTPFEVIINEFSFHRNIIHTVYIN
jgi:hypothetical protein